MWSLLKFILGVSFSTGNLKRISPRVCPSPFHLTLFIALSLQVHAGFATEPLPPGQQQTEDSQLIEAQLKALQQARESAPSQEVEEGTSLQQKLLQLQEQLRTHIQGAPPQPNAEEPSSTSEKGQWEHYWDAYNHPATKLVVKLIGDPQVQENFQKIRDRFQLKNFAIVQIVLLILWVFFRSWRFQRCQTFWSRIWVEVYTFVGYILLSSLAVPLVLYGAPFWEILKTVFEVIKQFNLSF